MLEDIGGFSVESRLGEENEKRGRTRTKAGNKCGVCRVREWPEKEVKWRDTSHGGGLRSIRASSAGLTERER